MRLTLIENFRAVFYAPFYAMSALGAFRAEGLDVEVQTSSDSTQTMHNLLAGGGEVSWGGPLRLMANIEKNPARRPFAFCEVIGKDPFFLVGRKPNPNFRFEDLLSVSLSIATEVPTPWLCLKHDLRLAGLDPDRVQLAPSRTMPENAAALRSGDAEVIQLFQPYAKALERSGDGHIWYAAASRGPASYTTFNTTRDYAEANPQILVAMCRAARRTLDWIHAHDGAALAELVRDYFPEGDVQVLAGAFDDYLRLGLWNRTPVMSRDGLEWLRDAGIAGGFLKRPLSYEEVFDGRYAEEALRS